MVELDNDVNVLCEERREQWRVSTTLVICLSLDWTRIGGHAKTMGRHT